MNTDILTQGTLKELFHYCPESGVLTWKCRDLKWFKKLADMKMWNKQNAGKAAGFKDSRGYIKICLFHKSYRAPRLIWMHWYGVWPYMIDHINHIKTDDRIFNLRDVTSQVNSQNLPISSRNKTGIVGVCWNKAQRKWAVHIARNFIGWTDDFFEACCIRKSAEIKYGYHPNHGK